MMVYLLIGMNEGFRGMNSTCSSKTLVCFQSIVRYFKCGYSNSRRLRKMKNLMLLEWKKVKWPVLIVLLVATAASMILSSTLYKGYSLEYDLEAWEVGMDYLNFLFPLIASLPVGWLMYYERKDNFIIYTLPRVSKRKYLLSKWIVLAGSAGVTMFIVMFVGVLTALYLKPEIIPDLSQVDPITGELISSILSDHFMGELFANHPVIYGLLISVWRGALAGIIATLAFVLSLYVENLFVILTGPFIYEILENFILSVLGIPEYRLATSFGQGGGLDLTDINKLSLAVGPLLLILFISILVFYFKRIKKMTVYPS